MNLMTISPQGIGMDGPTAAQQVVNNADTMPQAWMVIFTDPTIPNDVGRIHIVHCLTLFPAPMGATQGPVVHNIIYRFDWICWPALRSKIFPSPLGPLLLQPSYEFPAGTL
jgi:hypothetical protein